MNTPDAFLISCHRKTRQKTRYGSKKITITISPEMYESISLSAFELGISKQEVIVLALTVKEGAHE
jgi:predicted HicB family RNase H-like nuclease